MHGRDPERDGLLERHEEQLHGAMLADPSGARNGRRGYDVDARGTAPIHSTPSGEPLT